MLEIRICACLKDAVRNSLNFWMRSFSSVGLHAGTGFQLHPQYEIDGSQRENSKLF